MILDSERIRVFMVLSLVHMDKLGSHRQSYPHNSFWLQLKIPLEVISICSSS
jgi:hypothetical protein